MTKLGRTVRHELLKSEINIVPLLDVLLVLLVIFMAVEPIVTHGIEVELPNTTESQSLNMNDYSKVIIEVSKVGNYSLVIGKERINHLLVKQVMIEIQRRLSDNQKTFFLIAGEKEVPYDEIIKVLNLLRSSGVKSVGLMTQAI